MARGPGGRQLSLFGEPAPRGRSRSAEPPVGPAAVTDALRDLAAALPAGVRLGTSSWSFPGWEGLVYDRRATAAHLARHGLAAYACHPLLRAVGIDRTYYAPLPASDFATYASAVPQGFRFLVKAASACTDPLLRQDRGAAAGPNPRFLDAAFAAGEIVAPYVEGLGHRAGALVFQFPPLGEAWTQEPARFADALARFLARLPVGPTYAVELRDRALIGAPYVAALCQGGAVHGYAAHPRMPSVAEQRAVIGRSVTLVGRWMLHAGLGYEAARERYAPFSRLVDEDPETRGAFAALCREQVENGGTALVTANNKAEGSAPETVVRLARRIVGPRAPACA
jgi:uncharacterized protein YecE (DUF72 family)